MKVHVFLPFLFLLLGCENNVEPLWLSGLWKGTFKDVYTSNAPTKHFVDEPAYQVVLTYNVSTNSGNVLYPTLGCSSTWVYLKTQNDTLFFEEKITSNENQIGCVDKMQYKIIKISENEITVFGYRTTSNSIKVETKGVFTKAVTRVSQPEQPNTSVQLQQKVQKTNDAFKAVPIGEENNTKLEKLSIGQNQEVIAKATPKDGRILGIWQWDEIYTQSGMEVRRIMVWDIKPNYLISSTWNNFGSQDPITVKWKMEGNAFYELNNSGGIVQRYDIFWDDNYQGFRMGTEGGMNNAYFQKVSKNPLAGVASGGNGSNGGNDKQCGYCEGRGTVRCCDLGGFYKPDCLSKSVYINCMTSPTPCELRVTCCRCNGTGRY